MSFTRTIYTSGSEPVVLMRAINGEGNWTIFASILRPDDRMHTHQLSVAGPEGYGATSRLLYELNTSSADAVKQGMLDAVASGS